MSFQNLINLRFSLSKFDLKNYNQFSNDGSFLDQFKQLKDKKMDQKLKSFRTSQDKNYRYDFVIEI